MISKIAWTFCYRALPTTARGRYRRGYIALDASDWANHPSETSYHPLLTPLHPPLRAYTVPGILDEAFFWGPYTQTCCHGSVREKSARGSIEDKRKDERCEKVFPIQDQGLADQMGRC